jgi:NAD(P)-dependent dehydrogenase (short-subunit alcohol dehydrogenase family)
MSNTQPQGLAATGVVVTGGSSGLGKATALLLAEAGRPVAVWGTSEARVSEVAQLCRDAGVKAVGLTVDVRDPEAAHHAARASRNAIGPIGGVVCSAARLAVTPVGHLDFAQWQTTLDINLTGTATTLEATLPSLREVGRGASFVAVASTEAFKGSPYLAAYTASKHGVLGLVRASSRALAPEGIRVNAVCAGAMDTPMMTRALADAGGEPVRQQMIAAIPLGYISDPREVGYVIRFLLSPEASYVTGAAVPVDGGMLA